MGTVPKQLKKYQFKPGQSGNPKGRPKDTMKDFARELLKGMNKAEKLEFLNSLHPGEVWKMAEGKPSEEMKIEGGELPFVIKIMKDEGKGKDS